MMADLAATSENLTKRADDLDNTQRYLDQQVKRMDTVVDKIEAPAGRARPPRRTAGSIVRRPRTRFAFASS
jgi:hypothetical protein